jgi:hypothetical protein
VFLVALPAHADTPPDPDLYRLQPPIEVPLIAGGTLLWAFPFAVATAGTDSPFCGANHTVCDLGTVNWFDRELTGTPHPSARIVADVTWAVPVAGFVVFDLLDVGPRRWRTWLTDLVIIAEPVIIDGVLGEIFRRSVRRPRPYLYQLDAYPDERTSPEATLSFYAVDVSKVFALASAISYTWSLRHPGSPNRKWVWLGMYLLSSTMAVARVLSGDNFVSDVLVGAAVGGSIGLAWPALRYWMFQREKLQMTLSISPAPNNEGGIMASVGGRF